MKAQFNQSQMKPRATAEEVLLATAQLNPLSSEPQLRQGLVVSAEDPFRVVGSLNWGSKGLTELPSSFASLQIEGNLNLSNNRRAALLVSPRCMPFNQPSTRAPPPSSPHYDVHRLNSLPENIGLLRVGGSVLLEQNALKALPSSFPKLEFGSSLGVKEDVDCGYGGRHGPLLLLLCSATSHCYRSDVKRSFYHTPLFSLHSLSLGSLSRRVCVCNQVTPRPREGEI